MMTDEKETEFSAVQKDAAEQQIFEQSKRIDYYLTEYSMELLATKMRDGEFEVPAYQREYTWEEARKWRFIESILMSLPIPFLFFWENPATGKLEIVDGSQRLRTIQEFIFGELTLGDLDKLPLVSGFAFKDLPESRQRKFKNRSIRGIVLNEHADEQARFDIFERINTGSKVANKAEVRRGALRGPFLDLVIELAKDARFIELTPVSDKQLKEREREELVTRFFAYGDGLDDYADEVSPFLFSYARKMNQVMTEKPAMVDHYRQRFAITVAFIRDAFPFGFRRSATGRASPRARFESIAVGTYLALQAKPTLTPQPERVQTWIQAKAFSDAAGSDGANAIGRLQGRINYVRDHLLEG
jgi:Protein of unknown function DUF262